MKEKLVNRYFNLIDWMHKVLVKQGAKDPYHGVFREFVSLAESSPEYSILEVGSRNVTGITRRGIFPSSGNYVGFDIHDGEGVDVVGDAHSLSSYFTPGQFDFVYSISVLEHLLFPWKAVMEMNKVLNTGGYVFLSTHPVWPAHELPWDFWRFPPNGFHAMLNKFTGFEIVSLSEGLPCKMYSLAEDAPTRTNHLATLYQGVSVVARKVGEYRSDLLKWDIDAGDVLDTIYPKP